MECVVPFAAAGEDALELGSDSGGLIDRNLLLDRHMQAHVEKRVRHTVFWGVLTIEKTIRIVEHVVVLGMQQHDLDRDGLQPLERLPRTIFAPSVEEELAGLIAGGSEHREEGNGKRETQKRRSRFYASPFPFPFSRVFARYSHRSLIKHRGHSGARALQT